MENGNPLPAIGSERAEKLAAMKSRNNQNNLNKENTFWPMMVSLVAVSPAHSLNLFRSSPFWSRKRSCKIRFQMPNWKPGCAGIVSDNLSTSDSSTTSLGASRRKHPITRQTRHRPPRCCCPC